MEGPHPPMADGVPPSTPSQVPAERGSLTAEPAGRCPGAAAPGRAGGWGSLVPPRRGDGDILRLPRHRSCRETEPRGGARAALTGTGSSRLRRRHTLTMTTPRRARHQLTGGLLRRDLRGFGEAKDRSVTAGVTSSQAKLGARLKFRHGGCPLPPQAGRRTRSQTETPAQMGVFRPGKLSREAPSPSIPPHAADRGACTILILPQFSPRASKILR